MYSRGVQHPLIVRLGSSDVNLYRQILIDREYRCLDDMTDVHLVIDCGANVGFSSAYFLSQFPNCKVIAVEPDLDNFGILQRNLERYGDRVQLIHAGIWSCKVGLVLSHEPYRGGREWTRQVRVCKPNEQKEVEGVDIASLLARSGHDRISLLKVDIEGAEAEMFSKNVQSWLDKVDAIAIELHD